MRRMMMMIVALMTTMIRIMIMKMIVLPPAKRSDGYNKHSDYGDVIDVHIMEFSTDQIE